MNPFAQSRHGEIVHAERADRQDDGPFSCPECSTPLILKAGEERSHHFAHAAERGCRPNKQLLLRYATDLIRRSLSLRLPERQLPHIGGMRAMQAAKEVVFDNCSGDDALGIAGLILEKQGKPLALSFRLNRSRRAKQTGLASQDGISAIEIDLSRPPVGAAEIDQFILAEAPRSWLYHSRDAAWRAEIAASDRATHTFNYHRRSEPGRAWLPVVAVAPQRDLPEHWPLVITDSTDERRSVLRERAAVVFGALSEGWLQAPFKDSGRTRLENGAHSAGAFSETQAHLHDIRIVRSSAVSLSHSSQPEVIATNALPIALSKNA